MESGKKFLEELDEKTIYCYKPTKEEDFGEDFTVHGTDKELNHFFKTTLQFEPSEKVEVIEGSLVIEYQYAGFEPRKTFSFGKYLDERSDATIAARKDYFNQRFLKHEIDTVRHKHGSLIDDSLRSAEAQRIKQKIKNIRG